MHNFIFIAIDIVKDILFYLIVSNFHFKNENTSLNRPNFKNICMVDNAILIFDEESKIHIYDESQLSFIEILDLRKIFFEKVAQEK